jgi:hypothetical protein
MSVGPLSVNNIIQVSVSAAKAPIAAESFNQGLIVGPSTTIPSYGTNPRIRQYSSLAGMVADTWSTTAPEYLAATLYFGAASGPGYVYVGRQDLTAIQTAVPHSGAAGTGYKVGDQVGVTQGSASNGVLTVLTTNPSTGAVLSLGTTIGNQGTGYSVQADLATTNGSGTGLFVDITAVGETYLQAVEACQQANANWYGFMCCNASDTDHLQLAEWATANWQAALYIGTTSDSAVVSGTAGNIALQLQALNCYSLLIYSTTQGGNYTNNAYSAAAVLGQYCGLNTGLAGSAFTLNLQTINLVAPEPLTQTQYSTLKAANCNAVMTFGPLIGVFSSGVLGGGLFFDQILFRAMLVNMIQVNELNILTSVPKVPQTDPGEHQLINGVDAACSTMVGIGYIGPGWWVEGNYSLPGGVNISYGQALPQGYLDQAQSYAYQSLANKQARQAMPIYCFYNEAGAVHSVSISVNVQL